MKALLVLLPAVALTLMSATDTPAAMQPSPSTTMVQDSTDKTLADKIRAMFSTEEGQAVKVEVANRVATLKGKVNSEEAKAAIAKKVAQVKELRGVNNQLETK